MLIYRMMQRRNKLSLVEARVTGDTWRKEPGTGLSERQEEAWEINMVFLNDREMQRECRHAIWRQGERRMSTLL